MRVHRGDDFLLGGFQAWEDAAGELRTGRALLAEEASRTWPTPSALHLAAATLISAVLVATLGLGAAAARSGPPAAAHIHCGAAAGANAGVSVPLGTNLASPIEGSAALTDAQLADLQAGKCYVNVHTAANKGGEVRGQLTP